VIYLAINIVAFLVCAWAALAVLTIFTSKAFWKFVAALTFPVWVGPFLLIKAIGFLHYRLDATR
jgi:hypothetical protein